MSMPVLSCTAKHVLEDRKGAAVMELGLVLPVLLFMIAGMIDVSRFVCATIDVEQAAQRTTAFALAKRPTSSNATYLATEAASAAGVSTQDVTAEIFLECDGVRQSKFNTPCAAGETSARFVSIAIQRDVPLQFDWAAMGSMFGMQSIGSSITVHGDSLVRIQ
ncbi:TadE/TadG family type IV pilus assembly protein [Novosphingobium mangrovi (ex Huang et al. 2023)]|uniref:Pilus assembly protein n=1 Tax=Novosphingobium mangrovi (ex Huang et al. 2023) TaxID=2976432 RepID=A0ABT2I0A8_9SPHN|nr:TadE/TadG family type IV pilus assembly protein [Novosphingobium mangrovi (ex Huang et al. 2023)]MCT2398234.1 pilus assembly protein [Novosphingobium mangrovi (ex Huang et al. 2023)]